MSVKNTGITRMDLLMTLRHMRAADPCRSVSAMLKEIRKKKRHLGTCCKSPGKP